MFSYHRRIHVVFVSLWIRFDSIDSDFKMLMEEAKETPNVIEATNKGGWYERLEALQAQLSLCEKALAEYLETKRLAFPRFYFVSSADLLDILSNGNSPATVSVTMSHRFFSPKIIISLKFLFYEGKQCSFFPMFF